MLAELYLENFRRFGTHTIDFGTSTILVGPNNAGKSTVVEALRLVALVTRYGPNLPFREVPDWVERPAGTYCVRPSLRDRGFDLRGAIHRLEEDRVALIGATFTSGQQVEVFIGPDRDVVGVLRQASGASAHNKRDARDLRAERIAIQPQVTPLLFEEGDRDRDYVRRFEGSARAPQHFRNQLRHADFDEYAAFKRLAEESWPGLQILEVYVENDRVYMIVRDRSFSGEISMMGHGLQMWLQTMWFLVRNRDASTLVLDEPDVYMHADLQRGLVRNLRQRHEQLIVATHSVEIISEAAPEEIVIIDGGGDRSAPAADLAAVQEGIDDMGGVQNLQLLRMWNARRVLLVEGNDLSILERLHATLHPQAPPLGASPTWSIGGWGGFSYAIGSSMALRNSAGNRVRTYCLLDRDYHLDEEIRERCEQAEKRNVALHIWKRKELENYLLVPGAIARLIAERNGGVGPTEDEVAARIDAEAEAAREEVLLACVDAHSDRSSPGPQRSRTAAAYANKRMAATYGSAVDRAASCPGKTVLKAVRKWAQDKWGVSMSVQAIASELRAAEIDPELRSVLAAINAAGELPERYSDRRWTA
jgi:predicted ATPase